MSNSLNISAASHEGKLFIVKQTVEANPAAVNSVDEASIRLTLGQVGRKALLGYSLNSAADTLRLLCRTRERLCTGQHRVVTLISPST